MAYIQMNKFYNDVDIEDTFHSKEKAYSTIKVLKEHLFEALKDHLYGSKTAIEKIEKLKIEIQKTKITYDIL
jgi:hypothetical protein|tara:strand:+ start:146 stop:361 length:216 start_codon:yes stop_codon:yes gene_type:complete